MNDNRHIARRRVSAAVFWLTVWQIAAMRIQNKIILITPAEAFARLAQLAVTGTFWKALCASAGRVMGGFGLAVLAAVPLACFSVRAGWVEDLLKPVVKTMRAIPVASFVILSLILFSSRFLSVFIAFTVAFPMLYTGMTDALRSRSLPLREAADVFRVRFFRRIRYLDLPEILPHLATVCRMAVGMAWKAGVAAELIGIPRSSIGEHLQQAKTYLDMADLFAWTVAIVAVSALCERGVLALLESVRRHALRF